MNAIEYHATGAILIDTSLIPNGAMLRNRTRLSLVQDGNYVAILEVLLPEGLKLCAGKQHVVKVRIIADPGHFVGGHYDVYNPTEKIGDFDLITVEPS